MAHGQITQAGLIALARIAGGEWDARLSQAASRLARDGYLTLRLQDGRPYYSYAPTERGNAHMMRAGGKVYAHGFIANRSPTGHAMADEVVYDDGGWKWIATGITLAAGVRVYGTRAHALYEAHRRWNCEAGERGTRGRVIAHTAEAK